jgi:hypothetical protein
MAQRVVVTKTDDVDGGEAAETKRLADEARQSGRSRRVK